MALDPKAIRRLERILVAESIFSPVTRLRLTFLNANGMPLATYDRTPGFILDGEQLRGDVMAASRADEVSAFAIETTFRYY